MSYYADKIREEYPDLIRFISDNAESNRDLYLFAEAGVAMARNVEAAERAEREAAERTKENTSDQE